MIDDVLKIMKMTKKWKFQTMNFLKKNQNEIFRWKATKKTYLL